MFQASQLFYCAGQYANLLQYCQCLSLVRSAYRSNLISISGGIIGFSSSEGTMQRWVFTSHIVAEFRSNLEVDLGIKKGTKKLKDLRKSKIKYDEDMVSKCCDLLKQWPPMFDNSTCIVSLSSGVNASADVKSQVAIQV